jgi:hypothetical protein
MPPLRHNPRDAAWDGTVSVRNSTTYRRRPGSTARIGLKVERATAAGRRSEKEEEHTANRWGGTEIDR